MHDRPTQAELLDIIAETLRETVVPATAPHARHQARIAANLCAVLAREMADTHNPATIMRRLEIALGLPAGHGGIDGVTRQLRLGGAPTSEAIELVSELVRMKLDVVKPGYDQHGAEAEHAAVS